MVRNLARISWLEMEKCDKKKIIKIIKIHYCLNYNVKKQKKIIINMILLFNLTN